MRDRVVCWALMGATGAMAMGQTTLLDPTFGTGGMKILAVNGANGDVAEAVVLQPDGKILIGGSNGGAAPRMTAVRLLPNGDLDPSFSNDGIATASIGQYSLAHAIALQADGSVVLGGSAYFGTTFMDVALARFLPTGALDNGFSGDGRLTVARPTSLDVVLSLRIDADGRIVAGGVFGGPNDMMAMRVMPDGALDNSFSGDGIFSTSFHTGEVAEDLLVRPDGSVLLAGAWRLTLPDADIAFLQLQENGTQDPSFGTNGLFEPQEPVTVSVAASAELVENGSVLFAGYRFLPGSDEQEPFLGRITADGAWDNTFGIGGRSFLSPGAPYVVSVRDMALLNNGKVLITCDALDTSSGDQAIVVLRALPDGTVDTGFGNAGRVVIPCPDGSCSVRSLAVQPDDHVVAVGFTGGIDSTAMWIMRWLPEDSPVGIQEAARARQAMSLSPDPCAQEVLVTFPELPNGPVELTLHDRTGRQVAAWASTSVRSVRLALPSGIADGMYFMRATSAGITFSSPLAVVR